jgi:hypothetical protein
MRANIVPPTPSINIHTQHEKRLNNASRTTFL